MPTEIETANTLATKIAAGLPGSTTRTNDSGLVCGSVTNGSLRIDFRGMQDGTVTVVQSVDLGPQGHSWCGSRSYKSAAGALRFARDFLK